MPQGSILGPLLFILFIDDIYEQLDPETRISLYADDTKIWKPITSERDCEKLQLDIYRLHDWCVQNKMKFNADKCKALTITATDYLWTDELPLSKFFYTLGDKIIDYVSQERDLGIIINSKLNFEDHHKAIISKAYQYLGLTKRSCHFVVDTNRRRNLHLAMVRSHFEHCTIIWSPKLQSQNEKFDQLQKRAIKWILKQKYCSYSDIAIYYSKCKQTNLLPISKHFELNDLLFFHKILYEYIDIQLPHYIQRYSGQSKLRSARLDSKSFIYTPDSHGAGVMSSPVYKSFFYRVIHLWNKLSLELRNTACHTTFKRLVKKEMWDRVDSTIACN